MKGPTAAALEDEGSPQAENLADLFAVCRGKGIASVICNKRFRVLGLPSYYKLLRVKIILGFYH